MKGIVLAGGSGSRLYPITAVLNKQLLPVYDKPMIYYPISVLMLIGIKEILVISTEEAQPTFKQLLGDGSSLGLRFEFAVQKEPRGLAEAFIVGADFIGDENVALILGDNIFFGHGLPQQLRIAAKGKAGATTFAYRVGDPERYGVVEFNDEGLPIAFTEKPEESRSSWAVTGLYFYDSAVIDIAMQLTPSSRGELEIVDIHQAYLEAGKMRVERLGRGVAWLDTGTHESLLQAGQFVQTIEERQNQKIACLEEIAFRMGYIDAGAFEELAHRYGQTTYGTYLKRIAEEAD
ncbi:MAG: glucose-1-phosphate thymidylyltransferase [Magnetovibrio sp.]|nr:glucose-1-phosphate thymidylyltransferase [Magnetovibrio sp.]